MNRSFPYPGKVFNHLTPDHTKFQQIYQPAALFWWSGNIESGVIRHCEEGASPTKQSHGQRDCFVAALLAMTIFYHAIQL